MKFALLAVAILLLNSSAYCQQEAKVLVDIFTNSHCSPCATMHGAVNSSITSTARGKNVIVVYNHMSTYQDDPIYQANTTQPRLRATWLGGVSGTPTTFFNGVRQTGSYSQWPSLLDGLIAASPRYSIVPVLTYTADSLILSYTISRSSVDGNPSVYGVLVENVTYKGRNGVSDHDGAMRALFTLVEGNQLSFNGDNVATGRIALARQGLWDITKLRVVVSVQDPSSKKSLQAQQVSAQMATDVDESSLESSVPATVEVVSVSGSIISRQDGMLSDNNGIVAQVTSQLSSGAYFVRIVRGTNVTVRSIAITR